LVGLVQLVPFVGSQKINQTNQTNPTNSTNSSAFYGRPPSITGTSVVSELQGDIHID